MDFKDKIIGLANRTLKQKEIVTTEESTKHTFVMPFLQILGYDVFNPEEVIPEFTADHSIKKGEKVDYAIKKEESFVFLIECKAVHRDLSEEHASQLYRYFSVTETKFAILTNGVDYHFYTDLDEPNKMDNLPFFRFSLSSFNDHHIDELKKFTKSEFDLDEIVNAASSLKYSGAIKELFDKELVHPSDEFVKFFASKVYSGRITQNVMSQFKSIVKSALNQNIRERISDKFKSALEAESKKSDFEESNEGENGETEDSSGIETTEDELDAFNIVKSICRQVVDPKRVFVRDTKSYCGILLDDNNRKPIVRLHFNTSQLYVGTFIKKKETRHKVETIDDIFNLNSEILDTLNEYEDSKIEA